MKIPQITQRSEAGSTLLVALIITAIMGITLASYLVMTQSQNVSVVRSQTWNAAMALTEAGIEDGLALINKNNTTFDQLPFWVNSASSDGYTVLSDGRYYVKRLVDSNNWGTNYYEVFIDNSNTNSPVITAVGYVAWKYSYAAMRAQSMFAAAGVNSSSGPQTTSRQVNVRTKTDPLFAVAMAALQKIDLNGQNITTDSFDSADPLHSVNGLYPVGVISMVKSNGDIATDASIINSINVGNANIKGSAKTGPGGTVSVGSGGYVTGTIADDFNVEFPIVGFPSSSSWYNLPINPQTINGQNYKYVVTSPGEYFVSNLNDELYIATNVSCTVLVLYGANITGQEAIHIAKGAELKLFAYSGTFKIAGKGVVNENGNALSFGYYGMPLNTSVEFAGNASFTGTIYAPNADYQLGGGGSDTYDFVGASVTKSVKMNGKFNFHYDENLRAMGPGRGFIPTDWKEGG